MLQNTHKVVLYKCSKDKQKEKGELTMTNNSYQQINDLQKAKNLLTDRNVSLKELALNTNIPYESLKALRYNPAKIEKTSWERVNKLASIYNTRPNSAKNTRKPLIIETNKFVYVEEMDKYFKEDFPKASRIALTWNNEKKHLWKLELTEDTFDLIFSNIVSLPIKELPSKHVSDEWASQQYEYWFADTDSLEDKDTYKINSYRITHYLPFYDWSMCDIYLANWLLSQYSDDLGNVHLDSIAGLSEGLNAIAKPLYKYVFSLSNNLRTRKEGLLDSFALLDQEDSLAGLALMAHVRMHSNERHPNLPKRPFDPDTYIKNKLASAKTPYDPDDYVW